MATLSMRAPSMLPSIKCSNCGDLIEISMMGDHICRPQDYSGEGMHARDLHHSATYSSRAHDFPYPERSDSANGSDSPYEQQQHFTKPAKHTPPRLDVAAAQPFVRNDAYAASARSPRLYSPVIPTSHVQSAGGPGRPQVYPTRPARPERHESVDQAINLDCAFPPFPVSNPVASNEQNARAPDEQLQERRGREVNLRSVSPQNQSDRDEAKRNDFFSNKPSRSKSRLDSSTRRREQPEEPMPPVPTLQHPPSPPRSHVVTAREPSSLDRQQWSSVEPARRSIGQKIAPARPERPGGEVDRFIARLKEDTTTPANIAPAGVRAPMRPGLRAEMPAYRFPRKDPEIILERSTSEPLNHVEHPQDIERSATTNDLRRLPSTSTASSSGSISLPYNPRQESLTGLNISSLAPSRDSYTHGPSFSDASTSSSANSGRTGRTTPLSDMSSPETKSPPQLSYRARGTIYNPYEETTNENVSRQPAAWVAPTKSYVSGTHLSPVSHHAPSPRLEPVHENPYAPSPLSSIHENPCVSDERQMSAESNPYAPARQHSQQQYFQQQHVQQVQQQPDRRPPPWALDPIDETSAAPKHDSFTPSPIDPSPRAHGLERSETAASLASNASWNTQHSGSGGAALGNNRPRHSCRGCNQPIVGKSIRAADGRLTGRYHRACFVCTTCASPFDTAHFYVHLDRPYCERHYHVVNGSLCRGCDTGIEGPYTETDDRAKFHPACFCCATCRVALDGDYFDVHGAVYCERHAGAEVRRLDGSGAGAGYHGGFAPVGGNGLLGPPGMYQSPFGGVAGGGWKAERRRTRMGMMQPSWIGI